MANEASLKCHYIAVIVLPCIRKQYLLKKHLGCMPAETVNMQVRMVSPVGKACAAAAQPEML